MVLTNTQIIENIEKPHSSILLNLTKQSKSHKLTHVKSELFTSFN